MNNARSKKIIIGVIAIIIVAVFVCILYITTRTKGASDFVRITNYSDNNSSIPSDIRSNISEQIFYLLVNNQLASEDMNPVEATIRAESYNETTEGNNTEAVFLVDIEELKQTFDVKVYWSNDGEIPNNIAIECPKKQFVIYEGEKCLGMSTTHKTLEQYLPYTSTLSTGEKYAVYSTVNKSGEAIIEIAVNSCGNNEVIEKARDDVDEWLKENDFKSTDYEFSILNIYEDCIIK